MQQQTLTTTLTPPPGAAVAADPSVFVNLYQDEPPRSTRRVSMAGIYRMWLRALDDIAGGLYRPQGCPIEFEGKITRIWFDFYALPSAVDLPYELSASIGSIGPAEIVSLPRQRELVFAMTDHYDLDFCPISATINWQTPCYLPGCITTVPPALRLVDNRIVLSREVFGVAWISARAYARKYRLMIEIERGDNRLTGLAPVITAAWRDTEGTWQTKQLELIVPECVEHALQLCAGDGGVIFCPPQVPLPWVAYYSTCDCSLVDVRPQDVENWCKKRNA